MSSATIAIPHGLTFADLRLARDPQTGDVSFDTAVIERIEAASGLPEGYFMAQHEDAVAALITNGARSLGVQSGVESADAAGVLMGCLLLFDVLAQDVDWRTATA